MQFKPTIEHTDGVFGDIKSSGSSLKAHALLKKFNQLLALMLTQRTSSSQ